MAYEKQNFEDGQVLTADQLNHIEDGLMRATTLTVTIDEEGKASHTSAEIYAHVQSGGTAVLLHEDICYIATGACTDVVTFMRKTDDDFFVEYCIYDDGGYDFYEKLYAHMGSAIYRPNTAKVGQTIVVKSVDSNGRPTLWEAADLPSGGSSTLTVTIDDSDTLSHSNDEIIAHIESGGTVVLFDGSIYYPYGGRYDTYVYFTHVSAEEGFIYQYCIYDGNSVDYYESNYASYDSVESLIDEKLGVIENGSY